MVAEISAVPLRVVPYIHLPATCLPELLILVALWPFQFKKFIINCVSPFAVATFGNFGALQNPSFQAVGYSLENQTLCAAM